MGSMAYDSTDGYLLMFGGYDHIPSGPTWYLNDTWTFHAGHWTNITSGKAPSKRYAAQMADDPADHAVILFGGRGPTPGSNPYGDTWEFAHGTWTNITGAVAPHARMQASMSYDSAIGKVLLFAGFEGYGPSNEYTNDTWSFSGGAWTQLSPATLPPGRYGQSQADDAVAGQVVVFGGNPLGGGYLNDTWQYSNGTWTLVPATKGGPMAQSGVGLAYDAAVKGVVMFGGTSGGSCYCTWLFQHDSWMEYRPSPLPPLYTIDGQMAYDGADGVVVYFEPDSVFNATWQLNFTSTTPPPALSVTASATPLNGTAPLAVTFTATASGGSPPYSYRWQYGNGATASTENASYTYDSVGTYVANLTVTDTSGNSTRESWTVHVHAFGVAAIVSPLTGSAPLVVTFTALASGGSAPYGYRWQYGDGASSTSENGTHTYATAGTYLANLSATDNAGRSTSQNWTVRVSPASSPPPPLSATIQASPTSVEVNQTVTFTSIATGGRSPYGFAWSFGDRASATTENTTHAFAAAATYLVVLNVTDAAGSVVHRSVNITVTNAPVLHLPPVNAKNASGIPSWELVIAVFVPVAVFLLLVFLLFARRRRRKETPPEAEPGSKPPSA
jgi:PKD repeat protein